MSRHRLRTPAPLPAAVILWTALLACAVCSRASAEEAAAAQTLSSPPAAAQEDAGESSPKKSESAWFDIFSIFSDDSAPEETASSTPPTEAADAADADDSAASSRGAWRPLPHSYIPVTIGERLQSLQEKSTESDGILYEHAAHISPEQVISSVDQAFASRDSIAPPDFDLNAGAASLAAEAAGRVTAELLNAPDIDPLEASLYSEPPEPLDNVFTAARNAYQAQNLEVLEEIAPLLSDTVLKDYITLWTLELKLAAAPDDPTINYEFTHFIELQQGNYVGERAAMRYLQIEGSRLNAEQFNSFYERLIWNKNDPEVAAWHAYYALGAPDAAASRSVIAAAQALYRDARSPHSEAYRTLGDAVVQRDRSWAWTRVIVLLQRQQWEEARRALADVPRPELPASVATLYQILDEPLLWYSHISDFSTIQARLGVFVALRLVQIEPKYAARIAKECLDRKAAPFWRSLVWMRTGYVASTRLLPEGYDWYRRADRSFQQRPLVVVDADGLLVWQARSAMRRGNWYSLSRILESFPEKLAQTEAWTYWRARAYAARGLTEAANRDFRRIAGNVSFYGKLASDALKMPYELPSTPPAPPQEAIDRWELDPSIERARTFYRMHLWTEGHREWNWAMRGLQGADFIALAQYAKEKRIVHRMINTSLRSTRGAPGQPINLEQRFPKPHYSLIRRVSDAQSIPCAWVYGLIRQESRFIPTVSSAVGAQGLMQLMPDTAHWIAKRLGISSFDQSLLTGLEMNLVIGSAYLHLLYADLDSSYVLATAAYNAGPRKARAWRATLSAPMEAAVFIETIPYHETRDYVKNVLANMQTYSMLLPNPIRNFTALLGTVYPSRSTNPNLP